MKFELNPFFQALATVLIIIGGTFILFGAGPIQQSNSNHDMDMNLGGQEMPNSKIYVAVEGEAKVAVIDPISMAVIKEIDLSVEHEGGKLPFAPHNIQVSSDNNTVWVTGNATGHEAHSFNFIQSVNAHGEENPTSGESDEVIVIDPSRDAIIKRIQVKPGIHLAHVVLTPDSKYAYVTAQVEGVIYKIDARSYKIVKEVKFPDSSEPHGLRVSVDGSFAYVAMLKGKSLGVVDLKTDKFSEIPLGGAAVQAGVTPDNKYAVVSLYDTKQLGVYKVSDGSVSYINLPENAKGPIQMYATPDSRFIYLADQGYYFDQPSSEWVYKIDIETREVVKEIKAGKAPHGVVVSSDGKFVYVTNLLSGDITVIDTEKDEEIKRVKVGKEPNGISVWYKK